MERGRVVELDKGSANRADVVVEIVRLEKKTFPKHESLARTLEEELRKKNAGLLYVEAEGEVVGYAMYSWPSSLSASITKLAVKEDHRRQGYGEALLRAAIEKCRSRKVERVSLHVDPTRTGAVNLYKKLGFQTDCVVKSYYSHDRDAYRMYLEFGDAIY
ncbi:PREDICTED: uncharacterized protein LOC104801176 [Tarenaya hassleriana]|uniref:uncharacterized protein LOC104801176 n=1 Tax=Tarenaya hassleriana TaxID=28532 RepID=UPI00053C2667|nr:PREDICTED: uncharacterized protein LOC104801176 [Tarenaya hassleriana]XP_010522613.1 PREDICTED: uncharacterized protein LOC104801176 [Tarenaya hassleriana]XP_010522614.1 PREDICTED: uncharacterized protein LOC104801176 [Tarenaya hassleriana]